MAADHTILIADDNPDDVLGVKHALKRAGIANPVQAVTGGEDAVCYLKGEGVFEDRHQYPFPVLLLLDLRMPDRSGLEVLAWLMANPAFRPKAVVVLTGAGEVEQIRRSYQLGVDSFLSKPLVVEDLINVTRGFRGVRIEGNEGNYRLAAD